MAAEPRLQGLSRKLVNDGLLDEEKAIEAIKGAREEKITFTQYLVNHQILSAKKIAMEASAEFGLPVFDLNSLDMEAIPKDLVDDKLIEKHHALPLYKRGNRLYIGISDPTNLAAIDDIKFQTGSNTEAVLVEVDKLSKIIEKILDEDDGMDDMLDEGLEDLEFDETEPDASKEDDSGSNIDDTPVVKFINKMLLDAIKKGASDLHFEPYEKRYRVRFRIDGVLREVASPPVSLNMKLSARLKVMSKMDTAERRIPQDGRIKLKISKNKAIDFRVNT
ncbi:MAG: ATPase, T2SS/T4P/T4SS family, partial [Gammaproteobacteria bacterium]|nr:ATPase, T2SS/T4P/T4SS family [Gammaproteobacteria bacterium]